ncbi:MAG TPA: DUF4169 family protein [Xanthobacteraceae bacterium]|nr:DUF4169 family protein [Xanthobacteraceae bacterium]
MGELVNLRKVRKRVERDQAAAQAQINRVRFGRTKFERTLDRKESDKTELILNQHRLNHDGAAV